MQDYFRERTGLPISTYFSAYKYQWLHTNVPEVADAVNKGTCLMGTIDSWIIWNLTGGTQGRLPYSAKSFPAEGQGVAQSAAFLSNCVVLRLMEGINMGLEYTYSSFLAWNLHGLHSSQG